MNGTRFLPLLMIMNDLLEEVENLDWTQLMCIFLAHFIPCTQKLILLLLLIYAD